MNTHDNSKAQSFRSSEGKRLEKVVQYTLNKILNSYNIFVCEGNSESLQKLIKEKNIVNQTLDYNKLPVKRPCDQKQLEDYPDTDLFILIKLKDSWRVLGVISCKVSFHSRHTMVTFWSLAIRISSNIKYICVTEDKDQYHPFRPRSELGKSCKESTVTRRLLESFVDKIYIIKPYKENSEDLNNDINNFLEYFSIDKKRKKIFLDNSDHKYHTEYCISVRPYDDLIYDIIRWKNELFH